jgi:polyisoprenoid-binding protein YceI
MEGNIIGGWLEVPATVILDSSQASLAGAPDGKVKAKAHVQIPVTPIANAKWDGMSQVMQDAMDAKSFPYIIFELTDMTLKQPHAAGKPFEFEAKGELAVHGVTNKITMPVTIESLDKTRLKVSAEKIPLSMPDFKVTPPVKAGIFITKPDITITFDWFIAAPAAKAGAPK